jgi:diacylglycerol kinase family enzyme
VLPFGTFNHFAKDLGIPVGDDDAAAAVLVEGAPRCVDVGEVSGRIFLNNSSLGLYPRMVRQRVAYQRQGYRKWTAVIRAVWAALPVARRMHLKLSVDAAPDDTRSAFIFIGNNRYAMEGLDAGARARLDEGVLSLYLARGAGPWRVVVLALRAVMGKLRSAGDFEETTAREIVIAGDRETLTIAFDGEVATMRSPLTYRIRRRALYVMAPRSAG